MSDKKKIFLLDAYALIYRAHFAFIKNPRINSKGLNTSAVFGFTNTLLDVINNEKPSHIGVVFDGPAKTEREVLYTEYKANREEMPEDLRKAIPYVKLLIEAFNIPILEADGFEADDIIGTLAKRAEKQGFEVYMMTPDKDFGQLVSDNIKIFKPARGGNPHEVLGVKEVCEKFEIAHPLQVIDILGLMGDAVDNIPGIPGIGEKTAKKLIKEYGSVENLIAHASELKGKMQENVINFAEQGILSKKLAAIILDAPVPFEPEKLIKEAPNKDKILELFSELEFRQLSRKVLGEEVELKQVSGGQISLFGETDYTEPEISDLKTIATEKTDYRLVVSDDEIAQLISELENQKVFCFDTETSSLDQLECTLVGLAFSFKPKSGYYLAIPKDVDKAKSIIGRFKPVFENDSIEKIAQNAKFDMAVLSRYGTDVKGRLFDTMLAHYLLQPDMKHGMDILAETYLGYKPVSISELIGKKGKNQLSMADLDPSEIKDYAAEDADITLQLKEVFEPKIKENNLENLLFEIEVPLSKVLMKMEAEGINIDTRALSEYSKQLDKELIQLQENIFALSGVSFNIDSPKQLGEILFDHLKIDTNVKKTKTGQYATGEDILLTYKSRHEIIEKILDYRASKKLKSTYVDALPELVNKRTGRIHTSFNQTVAATGRLSSTNPNIQNIPIRTEKGQQVRKAFIARNEEYTLLAADYSQIELRIVAALSKDEFMIESFRQGKDIHASTAAKVFGVAENKITREQRSKAKAVNFGLLYGQGVFGLSQNLGIPRAEAKEIIDNYFAEFSSIKEYINHIQKFARENGYVETILNRRRYLKDINSTNAVVRGHAERNAINAPIQGSAADIIKIAMIAIQDEMEKRNLKSRMILQVHDELVFDAFLPEMDELKELVKSRMETAVKLDVPLDVELGVGNNWLDAH
ncbi:MAG: DNA polymerase I [Flavobacteriales bacterium]